MGNKLTFIIAHKYFRGYESFLTYYVDNIFKHYSDALVVIVDNNSEFKEEPLSKLPTDKNIVILDNNIECKFELGAYQVGIKYLTDNDLLKDYDYVLFTQDTFVLKNKYDFNILKDKNVTACPITSWPNDWEKMDIGHGVLTKLGLLDRLNETKLCWCNSFVLSTDKVESLYGYLKQIIITNRHQSESSERYLGRILLELNDGELFDIDGDIDSLSYYCHTVDVYGDVDNYFCKRAQQKNETTVNK